MKIVTAAFVGVGLLVSAVIVRASQGGATRDSYTYAGTLSGITSGTQVFSFVLHKGATSCPVTKSANVATSGAFAVTFGSSDAPCLASYFDGSDVTVDVSVAGVSITGQPVTPVPYAKYADTAVNFAPSSPISQIVPTGTVIPFAGTVGGSTNPPSGWLLCDGSAVSRTNYAGLFAVISTSAGGGDGTTTFNLPDYRGLFLRGFDQGNGADPGGASRTAMQPGGNTGDLVGTVQAGDLLGHTHAVATTTICTSGGAVCASGITAGNTLSTTSAGGSETRPKNAAVNYLIKY